MDSNRSIIEEINESNNNNNQANTQEDEQSHNPQNLRNRRRAAVGTIPIDSINILRLGINYPYRKASDDYAFSLEESRPMIRRHNYLRRRRRRRAFTYSNSESLDEVESSEVKQTVYNKQEYIDYRNFPINIDWFDVEDENSDSYEILKTYGNIGLSIYCKLKNTDIKKILNYENYLTKLVEFYLDNLSEENSTKDSVNVTCLIVNSLPDLTKINEILSNKLFNQKDYLPIKIILDIFEHYYTSLDILNFQKVKDEFFSATIMFYNLLSETEIENLYNKIYNEKSLFRKYKKKNLAVYKKRKNYINHYEKIKISFLFLIGGNSEKSFIL